MSLEEVFVGTVAEFPENWGTARPELLDEILAVAFEYLLTALTFAIGNELAGFGSL